MYEYSVIFECLHDKDIGHYVSYGIICSKTTTGEIVSFISDISTKKDFVELLANEFTNLQLSPVHFYDAVEDALS